MKKVVSYSDFVDLKERLNKEFAKRKYNGAIDKSVYTFTENPKEKGLQKAHQHLRINEDVKMINSSKGVPNKNHGDAVDNLSVLSANVTSTVLL